jgi:hypothetical protein
VLILLPSVFTPIVMCVCVHDYFVIFCLCVFYIWFFLVGLHRGRAPIQDSRIRKRKTTTIKSSPKPIGSMYAIYGNIYHQYTPNVSIYTIHGSYGKVRHFFWRVMIPVSIYKAKKWWQAPAAPALPKHPAPSGKPRLERGIFASFWAQVTSQGS